MTSTEHRFVSTVRTVFFLLLLIAFSCSARAAVEITILAQRPDGEAVDKSSALPNYQVTVLRGDGFTPVDSKETRNMRDNKEWRARFDLPEGEEVILKLRRYNGTDYYIEDEKRVRLAPGASYSLVSKTRPVEKILIVASSPDGRPVDTHSSLPNYHVYIYKADGKTLYEKKRTLDVRRNMEWELSPNFVEGEKVVLRLKRYNGQDYFLEDEKVVVLSSEASYTLTSVTSPVQDVTILTQTPDGNPVDTHSSLPNYHVYIYRADGRILYQSRRTLDMRRNMEWELSPNFVEGEEVVLRLKRYNGQDYFLEDEKVVVLSSEASYTLTSVTSPVQDVTIVTQAPDGNPIDGHSAIPNYKIQIYRADGITFYGEKDTRDLRKGMIWNLNINAVEDEEAVLRIVRYDGIDSAVEVSRPVKLISGETYTLTSRTVPVEDVQILVTDDNGQVIDEKRGYPEYSILIYRPDGDTRYAQKSTRDLRKGKLWELNPNFVEGEEAVIRIRLYNGVEWTELNEGRTRMTRGLKITITPSRFTTTAPARITFTLPKGIPEWHEIVTADGAVYEVTKCRHKGKTLVIVVAENGSPVLDENKAYRAAWTAKICRDFVRSDLKIREHREFIGMIDDYRKLQTLAEATLAVRNTATSAIVKTGSLYLLGVNVTRDLAKGITKELLKEAVETILADPTTYLKVMVNTMMDGTTTELQQAIGIMESSRNTALDYETADKILSMSEHARIYVVPLFKLNDALNPDADVRAQLKDTVNNLRQGIMQEIDAMTGGAITAIQAMDRVEAVASLIDNILYTAVPAYADYLLEVEKMSKVAESSRKDLQNDMTGWLESGFEFISVTASRLPS